MHAGGQPLFNWTGFAHCFPGRWHHIACHQQGTKVGFRFLGILTNSFFLVSSQPAQGVQRCPLQFCLVFLVAGDEGHLPGVSELVPLTCTAESHHSHRLLELSDSRALPPWEVGGGLQAPSGASPAASSFTFPGGRGLTAPVASGHLRGPVLVGLGSGLAPEPTQVLPHLLRCPWPSVPLRVPTHPGS